jgi:hypothetical protein
VGGRTDTHTHTHTENIYSIFRDKLLLLGEHGLLIFIATTKGLGVEDFY